ncbi:MAG TPA: di-trans,poly-cis-decaprenylcistransferase [Candidatus Bathyarchaeota archaeon]|nr:di-trans,poly-cis-decaprenylcistransferase [Candidatus Bathyarchaeota archaeon]
MKLLWRLLYKLSRNILVLRIYESLLIRQVKEGEIPRHVALILDGNRRWARRMGLSPKDGHKAGADRVKDLLSWCQDLGISTLTVYAFSTENLRRRSREEIEHIFSLFEQYLKDPYLREEIDKHKVKVKIMGRLDLLPSRIIDLIKEIENKTKNYDKFFFNIAFAYGGRAEIVDAVKRIVHEVSEGHLDVDAIDEKIIAKHLYTSHLPHPDPDMVLRTSGEERLSNFLLWQVAYSELVFLDVMWPEFRRIDLLRAIRTYQKRRRRFGG